jgi:hypothetical protein
MNVRRLWLTGTLVACVWMCGVTLQSAYKGHANDGDVNAVLAAYPAAKGSANDACSTCHRSGDVSDLAQPGRMRSENHCDFCHVVFVAQKRPVADTLNAYGKAYLAAGRSEAAVKGTGDRDADGDGFSNDVEFAKGTNPGDRASNPSAAVAPSHTLTMADMRQAPVVEQAVLINVTKSRAGDAYNDYRGTRLYDVLLAAGMSDRATAVDLISYDGYERTVTVDEMKRTWPQAAPVMGLGKADLGPCGWVSYNARGLKAGTPLADARIMLAIEENGTPLDKARLDPESGRIVGHGPFRLIVPQSPPAGPDQSLNTEPGCAEKVAPERRFHESYDHNGGKSSHAVLAIRVKPLPPGTRDPDWSSNRDELIAREQILVFGSVTDTASRTTKSVPK